MELFDNMTEVQQFVNVDSTLRIASLQPFENEVKDLFLLDWLGSNQYDNLINNKTEEHNVKLLPYVQRVVANFCVFQYIDTGAVSIGNSGVNRVESDNVKTAYKYQVSAAKQRYLESGWNAVESMIDFLEKEKEHYDFWVHESRANCRKLMINSYREFKKLYHVVSGRWVFEGLRAIIEDIELFSIVPVLGQEFYSEIKAAILDNNLNSNEREVLGFLNKAVAYLTIEKAIAQKVGKIENNRFVFVSQDGDDAMNQFAMVEHYSKQNNAQTMGGKYLAYAKNHLIENKAQFPTFETWYDAKIESEGEVTERENPKVVVI